MNSGKQFRTGINPYAFLKADNASLTLEASIVMPFFCFLVAAFTLCIQAATVQMSLHSALNQTVKQVAENAYPLYSVGVHEKAAALTEETLSEVRQLLPEWITPLLEIYQDSTDEGEVWKKAAEPLVKPLFKTAIMSHVDRDGAGRSLLHTGRLQVTAVDLPSLTDKNDSFLTVRVSYAYPINLPFYRGSIRLTEQSSERLWIGM